jgi:hypothetical protein
LNTHIDHIIDENQKNIWLTYHGIMSQNLLHTVLDLLNSKSNLIATEKITVKKLSRIAIELLQNIINHGDSCETRSSRGTFLIEKGNDKITITSANLINNAIKKEISDAIDIINKSKREELMTKKMAKLMNGEECKENSAGIGLFEIAINSGSKLNYWFSDIDANSTMFCLSVNLMN